MPSIALPVSLRGQLLYSTRIFDPLSLFAASEPGVWFNPSDLTTLFQDTAGTTPVTTPGQSVGLMLDKSKGLVLRAELRGGGVVSTVGSPGTLATFNTSTGAGSAYRLDGSNVSGVQIPVADGRSYLLDVEQLTGTLQIRGTGVAGNQLVTSVVGRQTYRLSVATGEDFFFVTGTNAASVTFIVHSVKELPGNHAVQATTANRPIYGIEPVGGRRNILLATDTLATQTRAVTAVAHTLSFTGTGTVTLSGVSTAGPLVGTGASDRVSLTFTPTAGNLTLTVSGSVTLAQLETGSTATAYQRVTDQYNVTEAGVSSVSYLFFDGVNDSLATSTITPGVDKAQVFAGVRKLSDAAVGTVAEFSDSADTNNGTMFLRAPQAAAANYIWRSRGTVSANAISPSNYAAPISNVVTGVGDILGDVSRIRVNGVQVTETLTDQGTGNFLAYQMFIGARGGTSVFFSGHLYSLIVRFGPNLATGQISSTETWVAGKTGITI